MGPDPAVAAVRRAVRQSLSAAPALRAGSAVVVACSGGADSLALVGAATFVADRLGFPLHGVTVDHGVQPGSAAQAARALEGMVALGIPEQCAHLATVSVTGPGGPEAAARSARYAALSQLAQQVGAGAVLLGHTLDDQAETVLLGLAWGSGARSLAGMMAVSGLYRRPFLGLSRRLVHQAAALLVSHTELDPQLYPWHDPQNADPRFARVRVRQEVLPTLERCLGGQPPAGERVPGRAGSIARALARTAAALREDDTALAQWADQLWALATRPAQSPDRMCLDIPTLTSAPVAVVKRVLHRACLAAGCPAEPLTAGHIDAIHALMTEWHGQKGISLPAAHTARRHGSHLRWT